MEAAIPAKEANILSMEMDRQRVKQLGSSKELRTKRKPTSTSLDGETTKNARPNSVDREEQARKDQEISDAAANREKERESACSPSSTQKGNCPGTCSRNRRCASSTNVS
jgi:hypothetical protein